ncbi:MAG TPA: hypothetical protein PLB32_24095, partial [Acidobacteriota bacterium]|nr:hypothetical protein [Acidobacteriota bacterium]
MTINFIDYRQETPRLIADECRPIFCLRVSPNHNTLSFLTRDNLPGDPVRNSIWSNSGRACREAARGGNYG